ncbi:hypothetical protein FB639_005633, partial [Coemansia asiatica]
MASSALPSISVLQGLSALSTLSSSYDALVAIFSDLDSLSVLSELSATSSASIALARSIDKELGSTVALVPCADISGGRLVLSPTGSLDDDTDDVRKLADAVKAGVSRAIQAGSSLPAVIFAFSPPDAGALAPDADYSRWIEVCILAALDASYVTLVVREHRLAKAAQQEKAVVEKLDSLALVFSQNIDQEQISRAIKRTTAIERGRRLAVDMGYGDPERMTPYNCAELIQQAVSGVAGITFEEIKDLEVIKREYPLMYNSARALFSEKHTWPCVVKLEYRSPEPDS